MKNLRGILLASSIFLGACSYQVKKGAVLTQEDFQKAEWVKVPYNGEIYASYLEENIVHGETNWAKYVENVAKKNGAKYETLNGRPEMTGFRKKSVLIPDLDSNGFVRTKLGMYASDSYQRDIQSNKGPHQ